MLKLERFSERPSSEVMEVWERSGEVLGVLWDYYLNDNGKNLTQDEAKYVYAHAAHTIALSLRVIYRKDLDWEITKDTLSKAQEESAKVDQSKKGAIVKRASSLSSLVLGTKAIKWEEARKELANKGFNVHGKFVRVFPEEVYLEE